MKIFRKFASKFNKLKSDPRYCGAFMLLVFFWFLWDRVHNPLYTNLELFLSVEASLGAFMIYQNQGQKTAHDRAIEKMIKEVLENQEIMMGKKKDKED